MEPVERIGAHADARLTVTRTGSRVASVLLPFLRVGASGSKMAIRMIGAYRFPTPRNVMTNISTRPGSPRVSDLAPQDSSGNVSSPSAVPQKRMPSGLFAGMSSAPELVPRPLNLRNRPSEPPRVPNKTPLDSASVAMRRNSEPPPNKPLGSASVATGRYSEPLPPPVPDKIPLDSSNDAASRNATPPPPRTPLDPMGISNRRYSAPPPLPSATRPGSREMSAFASNQAAQWMMGGAHFPDPNRPYNAPPPARKPDDRLPNPTINGVDKGTWTMHQELWGQSGGTPLSAPPKRSASAPPMGKTSRTARFFKGLGNGLRSIFTDDLKESRRNSRMERMENDYSSRPSLDKQESIYDREY
jgi:hypothetical protein